MQRCRDGLVHLRSKNTLNVDQVKSMTIVTSASNNKRSFARGGSLKNAPLKTLYEEHQSIIHHHSINQPHPILWYYLPSVSFPPPYQHAVISIYYIRPSADILKAARDTTHIYLHWPAWPLLFCDQMMTLHWEAIGEWETFVRGIHLLRIWY